jgi:hypothetical protein
VRSALGSIERECGSVLQGLPLQEPLFQLMSHGVPTSVKAAIDEVRACVCFLVYLRLCVCFCVCVCVCV